MRIVALFLLAGCGDIDRYDREPGECEPEPACSGADNRHEFDGTHYDAISCDWYCKGGKWISKTWHPQGDGCWVLTSTSTSDGLTCR